ncbi:ankyrin repeat-containing domain protein [Cladorrhinum sp. PSN332]|nr:ankyrin repeat-containing domain protein [Cladorrhinum sp. PSN332]
MSSSEAPAKLAAENTIKSYASAIASLVNDDSSTPSSTATAMAAFYLPNFISFCMGTMTTFPDQAFATAAVGTALAQWKNSGLGNDIRLERYRVDETGKASAICYITWRIYPEDKSIEGWEWTTVYGFRHRKTAEVEEAVKGGWEWSNSDAEFETLAPACNIATCRCRETRTLEVAYEFPLWCAAWSIHGIFHKAITGPPTISLVFRQRVSPINYYNIFQFADTNNIDAVRQMLTRNPDCVNHRTMMGGYTALHFACMRPTKISFEIFQLLLRAGADLNVQTDSGWSVANFIAGHMVRDGFPKSHVEELTNWVSRSHILDELDLPPTTEAATGLRVGDVQHLIITQPASRLKLDEFDNTRSTPLYWAAKANNLPAIEAIIELGGVDINQQNAMENTALMGSFAFTKGLDCFSWLLSNGANPFHRNKDGYNTFTLACYVGRLDIVRHLLEHVPELQQNPNIRDGRSQTGLFTATAYDNVHVLGYLCETFPHVVDANATNHRGFSPIFQATSSNAHECLRYLLKRREVDHKFSSRDGVDVGAATDWGCKAEDLMLRRGDVGTGEIVVAFRELLERVKEGTAGLEKEMEEAGARVEAGEDEDEDEDESDDGVDVFFDAVDCQV